MFTGFSASVALHAVVVPVDAFLPVLGGDRGGSVLVAIVTGIGFITGWAGMAGFAARPVITVKRKIPVMVEGCGLPPVRAVADAAARCRCVQVEVVVRAVRLVA